MRLGGGVGSVLAGVLILGASAGAQPEIPTPTPKWVARHHLVNANLPDGAADAVYWAEDNPPGGGFDAYWVYVTGFVTESAGHTRIVTLKYPADAPGPTPPLFDAVAYFPDIPIQNPGINAGIAMIVHPLSGDIYVAGKVQRVGGTDVDYAIIKYNRNLQFQWSQGYNSAINGNDVPVDIGFDHQYGFVVVTGTSPSLNNGDDIVTIAVNASTGLLAASEWPQIGAEPAGVRRFNNSPVNGNDRAVELGGAVLSCLSANQGGNCTIDVVVAGTSYGGPTSGDDIVVIDYGNLFSQPIGDVRWLRRYNGPNNPHDVASGLTLDWYFSGPNVYVTGYTDHYTPPGSSSMMGGASVTALQKDYVVLAYEDRFNNNPTLAGLPDNEWPEQVPGLGVGVRHYDFFMQDDRPSDIQWVISGDFRLWVTGRAFNGPTTDVGTLLINSENGGLLCSRVFGTTPTGNEFPVTFAPTQFYHSREPHGYVAGLTPIVGGQFDKSMAIKHVFATGTPCGAVPWAGYLAGTGGSAAGRAVTTEDGTTLSPSGTNIWVVGEIYDPVTGHDLFIVRYVQP